MGRRRTEVSAPPQAELDQRQQQFEQQMVVQQEQSRLQLAALEAQRQQEAAIAEQQRTALLTQLEAAGNAGQSNYLSNILSLLSGQASASTQAANSETSLQAQDTQNAVQQNRAKTSQAQLNQSLSTVSSELERKRKRYVG